MPPKKKRDSTAAGHESTNQPAKKTKKSKNPTPTPDVTPAPSDNEQPLPPPPNSQPEPTASQAKEAKGKKLTKYEQINVETLSNEDILGYVKQVPQECLVITPENFFFDTPYVLASYLGFEYGHELRQWLTSKPVTEVLDAYTEATKDMTERSTLNSCWQAITTNNQVHKLTNLDDM